MTRHVDFLVVGSGPSGVAAAGPLVEAGADVLLIDAESAADRAARQTLRRALPDVPFLESRRTQSAQRHWILGPEFEALSAAATSSPKLRTPIHRHTMRRNLPDTPVESDNFTPLFSLTAGGMSTAWGAGVSCYTDEDLADCPVDAADLDPSFRHLAAEIGISGEIDDLADFHGCGIPLQPPATLAPQAESVLRRYGRGHKGRNGFLLGHARNAVLTSALTSDRDRRACEDLALCLWGCPNHSIYSSLYALESLRARGLHYLPGHRVERLRRRSPGAGGTLEVLGHRADATPGFDSDVVSDAGSGSPAFRIVAERVLLACGPPISARLVLDALGRYDRPIPFETAPAIGFAALVPGCLGRSAKAEAFGLSQVSFVQRLSEGPGDYAYGNLFAPDGILQTDVAPYLPMRLTAARRVLRTIMPAMLLGNCFLPGHYSRNSIWVSPDGALHLRGRHSATLPTVLRHLRRRLRSHLARCGAFLLPGGFQLNRPGDDIHLGAMLPMARSPEPWQCTADGEVAGLKGVFIADAASLPRISARPHTFTAMANARRMAQQLVG